MNGKLIFRGGFQACLSYIFNKEGAQFIGSNLSVEPSFTENNDCFISSVASQFERIANRSRRICKPVMHLSLSPHPDDAQKLDNEQKQYFVQQLLDRIGMGNCQWILAEHNDTYTLEGQSRPHLHTVVNRIPINSARSN